MSFFDRRFFVGMLAGVVALIAVGVLAILAVSIMVSKAIGVGGGSGPGSIPITSNPRSSR